jgi:SAM-dependent methyltransferase
MATTPWSRLSSFARPFQRTSRSLRNRGLGGTVQKVRELGEEQLWDLRLGVRTRKAVTPANMDLAGPNAEQATAATWHGRKVMYATPRIRDLLHALGSVPADDPRHLVDYGCGKGRVLIAARQLGYTTATGVELSPTLCTIAESNINALRRRNSTLAQGISVQNQDATEFTINPEHNVFYFYNPFGPAVLSPVLDQIVASVQATPRNAWLIYLNHVHRSLFDTHPGLEIAADVSTETYPSTLYRVRVINYAFS